MISYLFVDSHSRYRNKDYFYSHCNTPIKDSGNKCDVLFAWIWGFYQLVKVDAYQGNVRTNGCQHERWKYLSARATVSQSLLCSLRSDSILRTSGLPAVISISPNSQIDRPAICMRHKTVYMVEPMQRHQKHKISSESSDVPINHSMVENGLSSYFGKDLVA